MKTLARIGTSLPDGGGVTGVDAIANREYSHVNVDVNADANVDISSTLVDLRMGIRGPLRNRTSSRGNS